uniref:BHLH domain-containing protein n=1 Tax=Glossina brevipalpis TaxID=37001 RepID=A0A1A9WSY7_9MUSC
MEFRKRARLEVLNNTQVHNDNNNTLGAAGDISTALATIGGQSYLFNSNSNTTATTTTTIPANILLTICDENSDESQEYLIDSSLLAHIKQEHNVATQTSPPPPVVSQQSLLTTSLQPQCRFLTQTHNNNNSHKTINNTSTSMLLNTPLSSMPAANLITNAVQLPTGCEIYLVKEYIDSTASATTSSAINQNSETTIKIEPDSRIIPASAVTNGLQLMRQTNSTATVTNRTPGINYISVTSNSSTSNATSREDPTKRSFILEAYKKRDDKRRATHNEVERRRRDKINSWIFKLKEMLPTDIRGIKETQLKTNSGNNNNATRLLMQQQQLRQQTPQTTTRTPPSDSKSQILIKACEYIKAMQEEIKSLQKCLAENETLRLSNQRLQGELEQLRSNQFNNNNSSNIQLTSGVVINGGDSAEKVIISASATQVSVTNLLNHTITTTTPALTTYAEQDLVVREYND